jgi:hypothetical protein
MSSITSALPLAVARQVDLLCDEYEVQRRQGGTPDLRALLARVPAEARHSLRVELAAVEAEFRWQAGQEVQPDQLAEGFGIPADDVRTWVQRLVGNLLDTRPSSPTEEVRPAAAAREATGPWATPATEPALPCRFGEYDLLERLGEGGMGAVYRAQHRRLNKAVALKLIRPDLGGHPDAVPRFEREMQAVGRLDHPHVVEAQHAGEHDGRLFLVMKLLDGLDLARLVRRTGPLRPADAAEAVRQAAEGLQYVHEQGLVHRDVKPSNLMLTLASGGRQPLVALVKILDLGLARLAGGEGDAGLTQKGQTLGTVDYMAPEQQGDTAGVTIAADIYGLGGVLFFLLAGRPPFAHHRTMMDKLVAHRLERPPNLRALRPDLPNGLVRVVERMLAKAPGERFAEPRAVAEALAPLAAEADLAGLVRSAAGRPDAPDVRASVPAAPTGWSRRRRLAAALAVAAAVAAVVLVVLALQGRPRPADRSVPSANLPDDSTGHPAAPLTVKALRVSHAADQGAVAVARGDIGMRSFATRYGDEVRVTAELSEPASSFLLALNPNGEVQLCWPADDQTPPGKRQRLEFPGAAKAFRLDDEKRGGLQAFVLVASRRALPAYAAWRAGAPPLPWAYLPAPAGVVWRGDGESLDPVLADGEDRGTVQERKGIAPLAEVAGRLRAADDVEAVAVVAFPVLPKAGN